jgi:hypothetical protein
MMWIRNTVFLCIRRIRRRCLHLRHFSFSQEDGLPHERSFTLICVIGKYRETGAGKSKKLAKRQVRSWPEVLKTSVSDQYSLIPDPDPAFRLNTDPDPDWIRIQEKPSQKNMQHFKTFFYFCGSFFFISWVRIPNPDPDTLRN